MLTSARRSGNYIELQQVSGPVFNTVKVETEAGVRSFQIRSMTTYRNVCTGWEYIEVEGAYLATADQSEELVHFTC